MRSPWRPWRWGSGEEVRSSGIGTGVWSSRWLPGSRLVRGFETLAREAHRAGPRIGVPLASDDPEGRIFGNPQLGASLVSARDEDELLDTR